ncbi:hypothetical protein [Pannonibacter sp. SL95]|uniref:hypothetical protein n=1 Tax=Pannonibacter sp. SL95 TaxID=2995153 RepID=UPI00227266ED|nr:hypothetical protein [Pannonibacter sp. SL95]MCY1705263.1 hypothetical protein [Pannonibacter sp. SL95]
MVSNNSPSNETQASGPKPVSDLPCKDPDRWFVLGVVAAILLVIGMVGLAVYMLSSSSPWADRGHAMQVFQPFLVGMAGIVTLCTVVWRGLINEAQANEQRRQNDAKDMADVGLLLEKATTFLSDESLMKRGVGLAMLNTVITTPKSPYAQYALETVCDELAARYLFETTDNKPIIDQIRAIIIAADKRGIRTTRKRPFNQRPPSTDFSFEIKIWEGFPPGSFHKQTIFVDATLLRLLRRRPNDFNFHDCTFYTADEASLYVMARMQINERFSDCIFKYISVETLGWSSETVWGKKTHQFDRCDFSGALISSEDDILRATLYECCFERGRPPQIDGLSHEETVDLIRSKHGIFVELEQPVPILTHDQA